MDSHDRQIPANLRLRSPRRRGFFERLTLDSRNGSQVAWFVARPKGGEFALSLAHTLLATEAKNTKPFTERSLTQPIICDALWKRIEPWLPPRKTRRPRYPGREPLDQRRLFTAILLVLRTGLPWNALPEDIRCCTGATCMNYLYAWNKAGIWEQLQELLLSEFRESGGIDWSEPANEPNTSDTTISDALWKKIEGSLPTRQLRYDSPRGRKPLDQRKVLTGLLFVLRHRIPWSDLPRELGCGCGASCLNYLRAWQKARVWNHIKNLLMAELEWADEIDWNRAKMEFGELPTSHVASLLRGHSIGPATAIVSLAGEPVLQ